MRDAHPQSLPFIPFRDPSKGAPPPGSPNTAPIERDALSPETPYNNLSEFPVSGPPWGDVHPLSPPPTSFRIPRKELPQREMLPIQSPPKILS